MKLLIFSWLLLGQLVELAYNLYIYCVFFVFIYQKGDEYVAYMPENKKFRELKKPFV